MLSKESSARTKEKASPSEDLLNLEVKFLTQQFDTSYQWTIRAEGRVSFLDLVIRVQAFVKEDEKCDGKEKSNLGEVVLEDAITSDTPFVGEKCCIVWNSVEQQLSLCLMFASEEGYAAAWSALMAMQKKAYPPLGFDLLQKCSPTLSSPFPYSSVIHDDYESSLGFIECHAISLSILENQHYKNPLFFSNKKTVCNVLELANLDLLECLISSEVYPQLCTSLGFEDRPTPWSGPVSLWKLEVPVVIISSIAKDINLRHFQEEILIVEKKNDMIIKANLLGERIRNELACTLLASPRTLSQAKEALMVLPTSSCDESGTPRATSHVSQASVNYFQREVIEKMGNSRPERQVLGYLHFFRFLVQLCIAELGTFCMSTIFLKIFSSGLLEALSFVAEHYALPKGLSGSFLAALQGNCDAKDNPMNRKKNISSPPTSVCFNAAIEHELMCFLDVTITRINERKEEQLMNDIIRSPILADPVKYNGLVTFLFRQLLTEGKKGENENFISDGVGEKNPFLVFHLLGLHYDDGLVNAERSTSSMSEPSSKVREVFQTFIITKYIPLVCRGMLAVPTPTLPSDIPLVQFSSSTSSKHHLYLPRGISSPFIRVLEFLCLLVSDENRASLLKAVFNRKSLVLSFIDGCFSNAVENSRSFHQEVICGNIRFLKAVLMQLIPADPSPAAFEGNAKDTSDQSLPRNITISICRALTVERDTLGAVMHAYQHFGGHRRNSVFHSSVLSLLHLLVEKQATEKISSDGYDLRDIRDFIFFKHLKYLPQFFVEQFRRALLAETTVRLGEETGYSGSISVLSSIAGSELMRSSSKLRFVDEVEAASGGVDGTVEPSSISGLSPTVVANMIDSAEEKLKKKKHAALSSMLNNSEISGHRPLKLSSLAGSSNERLGVPLLPAKAPETKLWLKPPASQCEKPASARQPQASKEEIGENKRQTDSGVVPVGSGETVTLPKLKRRAGVQTTTLKP